MRSLFVTLPAIISLAAGESSRTFQRSSGCTKPIPKVIELGTSKNLTIDSASGETPRNYRIHVPKSYDPDVPVPLIFSFHGRGKDMEYQDQLSQFSNESFGFQGIAVYPEGVPVSLLPCYLTLD
jgi:poly(3-hydroxybutyrate) depolymerase